MLAEGDFRQNNFDLLRLFAALQVVYLHAKNILKIEFDGVSAWLPSVIELFPGVQIFFFISGFLLCKSFELNNDLSHYFKNRILRIYPALYGNFLISILVLFAFGKLYLFYEDIQFLPWVLAQLSVFQFYNPVFLRDFGVGVLNGSLWTIAVEIQFYVFLPIYNQFCKIFIVKQEDLLLALIIVFSSILFFLLQINEEYSHLLIIKIIKVTALPYLFLFVAGMWMEKRFTTILNFIENKVLFWAMAYSFLNYKSLILVLDVKYNYFFMLCSCGILCFLILSFAYSFRDISRKILYDQDISYGIYLYHMIVVNIFVEFGFLSEVKYLLLVYFITILFGILSWRCVELQALRLKKVSISGVFASKNKIYNLR